MEPAVNCTAHNVLLAVGDGQERTNPGTTSFVIFKTMYLLTPDFCQMEWGSSVHPAFLEMNDNLNVCTVRTGHNNVNCGCEETNTY